VGGWLGVGIASLVNVLNPRMVVVGGIFERLHPLLAAAAQEAVTAHALPPTREGLEIVPGSLGVDAPIIGAAELAFEPLLVDPALQLGLRSRSGVLASA
jgi:predicted NBD/HSP70 family sugar kinase